MITDREFSEYRALCATLGRLHEEFLKRKRELKGLLGETAVRKKEAYLVLARANRLTRHLTCSQRQVAGITYHLGEIRAKISQAGALVSMGKMSEPVGGVNSRYPSVPPDESLNRRELRQMGLAVVGMIDRLKKDLLQLDLLERRCRELILSINKALEAFRHEYKIVNRKIYPLGVFSFCHRALRSLWGNTFFTFRDMDGISALGKITGLVLKIADAPLI